MKRESRDRRPLRRHPMSVAALIALGCCIDTAFALPQGEKVVAGQVGFSRPGATSLLIRQRSGSGIVNWGGFSIDRGERVQIQQPQASSVLLNRVVGSDASTIFGQLSANGRVFLLNPNGVLFSADAQVNVGSLAASTLSISDADFLAGRYRFTGNGGAVANEGRITAAERGTVALLSGSVRNDGHIEARLGTVVLAAGSEMTLDLAGDGLSRIVVSRAAIEAQVANGGAIVADGGAVLMTASAVEAMVGDAVSHSGLIRARSLVEREGRIVLDGGDRGTTIVSGTVDARGAAADTRGGEVRLLGQHVGVTGPALVDASGAAGGGAVLVGGDLHGKNPDVRNAGATYVGPRATLRADATERGDGGRIVVWADEATRVHGTLSARGGRLGGDGGLVETSGRSLDTLGARVNASARKGRAGQWLLDPVDVSIEEGPVDGSQAVTEIPPGSANFESFLSEGPSVVTSGDIEAALNNGTSATISTGAEPPVTVSGQFGDISIASGTTILKNDGGDATLTLNALRHIVSSGGASIVSEEGRLNVDFNSNSGGGTGTGAIGLFGLQIVTNGGNVRMYGASNSVNGRAQGGSGRLNGITLSSTTIDTVPAGGGAAGNVTLRGRGGSSFDGLQFAGDGVALFSDTSIVTGSATVATSAGTGNVSIDGIAGPGVGGVGVRISGGETTRVVSTSGSISIVGIGSTPGFGGGSGGDGVRIQLGGEESGNPEVSTVSGGISIVGAGGAGGAGQDSPPGAAGGGGRGVYLADSVLSSGAGPITVTGTGGAGGNGRVGIDGGSGADGGPGIELAAASITTSQGAITLAGSAGAGGSGATATGSAGSGGRGADGVRIDNGSGVTTTSGSVSVSGTGGLGGAGGPAGQGGDGVAVLAASLESTSEVSIAGTGGAGGAGPAGTGEQGGQGGRGVYLSGAAVTGGAGPITVVGSGGDGGNGSGGVNGGSGGDGGHGIELVDASITTNQGAITLTGSAGAGGSGGAATDGSDGFGGWGADGVLISSESSVTTTSGDLAVTGTGGFGGTGGPPGPGGYGVTVLDASLKSTSEVSIVGFGGAGGAGLAGSGEQGAQGGRGVYLAEVDFTGGAGPITVVGTGGSGGNGGVGTDGGPGGDGGHGIELADASIGTNQGAITLTGSAGAGGSGGAAKDGSAGSGGSGADGVRINGSSVTTTSGNVTVTGTGSLGGADGSGDASASVHGSGVAFGHAPGSEGSPDPGELTTGSGAIRVTGFAEAPAGGCDCDQAGVLIAGGSSIGATAGGTIDIRGRGEGPASSTFSLPGVWLLDGTVSTSGSAAGTIVISGESTSGGPGLVLGSSTTVGGSATSGNIVLRAASRAGVDSLDLGGTVQSSGALNIRPGGVAANGSLTSSNATAIEIGEVPPATSASLVVDSTELLSLEGGFSAIVFGSDTHTGQISVLGPVTFSDDLTLQNGGVGSSGISIDASIGSPGNTVMLSSGGPVTQATGTSITAASLLLHGTRPQASFQLTNPGNQVSRLTTRFDVTSAASSLPAVNYVNAGALTIGPAAVGGSAPAAAGFDSATNQPETVTAAASTSGGDLLVRTLAGNLRLTQDISTLGSDITLVTPGVFDNAGSATLTPGGNGRWSIWASTWDGETRGGLAASTPTPNIYGCAYGAAACASGAVLPSTGNHYFYVERPTVTVTPNNVPPQIYGSWDPEAVVLSATFSGVLTANGDTAADAFSGNLSTLATLSSPVGKYPITVSPLTSPAGYLVSVGAVPGVLPIDPAPLTITADNKSKVYGAAAPALTRTVTGLVLGETESVIIGGQPFTTADERTQVAAGPVAIGLSPASAANYQITLVNGNLTITPAPLTIRADNKLKPSGMPNPELTATFSGFVLDDTPETAKAAGFRLTTPAQTLSPQGAYPILLVDPSVLPNYAINYIPGTLAVLRPGQLENPTRGMASETSDVYERNFGLPPMCFAGSASVVERAPLSVDALSIEWSRVRQKPNIANCVGLDQRNGCDSF